MTDEDTYEHYVQTATVSLVNQHRLKKEYAVVAAASAMCNCGKKVFDERGSYNAHTAIGIAFEAVRLELWYHVLNAHADVTP